MQVNEPSARYSPHGEGYVKVYRKLLTSAVFENPNLLKLWIWCIIRANWTEATTLFEGKQIQLERGQFITGRFSGSEECNMNPSTFYKNLQKLVVMGNITIKTDNKKSLITVVNYSDYQDELTREWQQNNNKGTSEEQQSNTDKNIRSKEVKNSTYTRPQKVEDVVSYMLEIGCTPSDTEGASFWDYFSSNGWKIGGKTPMKDWKAAARNWKRRKDSNGTNRSNSGQPKKKYQFDASKYPTSDTWGKENTKP